MKGSRAASHRDVECIERAEVHGTMVTAPPPRQNEEKDARKIRRVGARERRRGVAGP